MDENQQKPSISLIAAVSQNYAIGKNGDQICYISEDLKYFKKTTSGHPVIMGRKTYDALLIKPLPGRKNIILTTDKNLSFLNCTTAHSKEEALAACEAETENFVIGGGHIYQQFISLAEKLYITRIYENFEADAFFPEINSNEWEVESQSEIQKDPKAGYEYAFFIYKRKN